MSNDYEKFHAIATKTNTQHQTIILKHKNYDKKFFYDRDKNKHTMSKNHIET